MIQQDYYEEISVQAKSKKSALPIAIVSLVVAVGAFGAGIGFQFPPAWILTVAGIVLFVSQIRNLRVDYDYCFLPEEIEVDKIINKKRRRTAIVFEYSNIRFVAPANAQRIKNERDKNPNMRFTDYTSDEPKNAVYGFCLDLKGISTIILMEPSESMMAHIKSAIPQKVFED